jgi:predicted RNA-binding Zn ribbon-like protein
VAAREVNRPARALRDRAGSGADGVSLDHRRATGQRQRWPLSESIARELTGDAVRRLRICANDECRWVFNDHSPAGRRKWCDMSSCGNRAKAAPPRRKRSPRPDAPAQNG